jgi:hypothetical protein
MAPNTIATATAVLIKGQSFMGIIEVRAPLKDETTGFVGTRWPSPHKKMTIDPV